MGDLIVCPIIRIECENIQVDRLSLLYVAGSFCQNCSNTSERKNTERELWANHLNEPAELVVNTAHL